MTGAPTPPPKPANPDAQALALRWLRFAWKLANYWSQRQRWRTYDEVASDVLFTLAKCAAEWEERGQGAFSTYFSLCVRGLFSNRAEKGRRRKNRGVPQTFTFSNMLSSLNDDWSVLASQLAVAEDDRRDARADAAEAWARLRTHLHWPQRLVLALYYREGYTNKEIGKAIGMSAQRAQQIRIEALARCRRVAKDMREAG